MLTDYTSFDEIRAAIGVNDEELEDATLTLPMYEQNLVIDLDEIHDDIDTAYNALLAPLSADQERFQRCVQLFATYSVARHLLGSLPIFLPKRVQDGRAEQERVNDPYEGVREGVNGMYARMREKLLAAFNVLFPATPGTPAVTQVFAVGVGLSLDPVTNA
jgi:hypothetical protein